MTFVINKNRGCDNLFRLVLLVATALIVAVCLPSSRLLAIIVDAPIKKADSILRLSSHSNVSSELPNWIQQYFQWHRNRLEQLKTPSQWLQQPILVVRCLDHDRCGGTADRLKCLPVYLALAAKTNRLLFLRWTRPFPLENFMIPGTQFNWTVPDTLGSLLHGNATRKFSADLWSIAAKAQDLSIWQVEGAAQKVADDLFEEQVKELDENVVPIHTYFHELFLTMFRPAPAIQTLIDHEMKALELKPNEFVTAHIRAKYPGEPFRETRNVTQLQEIVTNAIECASSLAPQLPVYVASDTFQSLEIAEQFSNSVPRVVSHLTANTTAQQDPAHLNFAQDEDPSAFFSIFSDLFIMSQSRCVAFGVGGFGWLGSMASHNASCQVLHSKRGKLRNCSTR